MARSTDRLRRLARVAVVLASVCGARSAVAQEPVAAPAEAPPGWTGSAELALYVIPEEPNYLWPSLNLDRDWLHLGVRYNYEAKDTASFWAGANFEWGDRVTLALTPMFGVAVGDVDGVAPGFLATLSLWKLELYSEGEWFFDTNEKADSFYYSWSELTVAPAEWLSFGLAAQKTRAYQSARYIERGVTAGLAWRNTSLSGYVFEPFSDEPTVVISFGIEF